MNVTTLLASAIRGCIIAPPGKHFAVADLSNIEGRGAAWLSGEEWKLDAFRDFDAGTGPDLYILAYAKSLNEDHRYVSKENRQVGKVQELALQYGGGANAFATFAAAYNIDLEHLADKATGAIPEKTIEESKKLLSRMKKRDQVINMSDRAWVVCDSLKSLWRQAHPAITGYWATLDAAVRQAIAEPDTTVKAGYCKVGFSGTWLRIRLPSGRYLCYPNARIDEDNQISYMGVHQYTRKWTRQNSYGPKFLENITQAVSCDVLAYGMTLADQAGFEIVLSVHDELIGEHETFDHRYLADLMSTNPPWASGLPLKAEGFTASRYRK